MSNPPFVMSKYATKEDLLTDKCAWQEQRIKELEQENAELKQMYDGVIEGNNEKNEEIRELKRIIAESQKQDHVGTLGWNGKSVMMYAHNHDAVRKLPQGSYKLFASPVIQEGVQLVPIELLNRFPEINPSNYGDDEVIALNNWGIEVAMLNASKE